LTLQTTRKNEVQRLFLYGVNSYVFFCVAFFPVAFLDDADLTPAAFGFFVAEADFFTPPLCFDAVDFGLVAAFVGEAAFLVVAGFGTLADALFFVDDVLDFVEALVFGLASRGALGFDGDVERLADAAFFRFSCSCRRC